MKKNNTRVKTPTIYQMEATECGAASLTMVFGYYGKFLPLEQMRIETGVSRDGCNAKNILRAARKFGMEAKGYKKSLEGLLEMEAPCIIHWNFNHFVVLNGFKRNKAVINDPAKGTYSVSMETFDESYTGVALMFDPSDTFVPEGKPKSVIKFAFSRMKGAGSAIIFSIVCSIIASLMGIILPGFSRIFLDRLLTYQNPEWFYPFIIALSVISLLSVIVSGVQALFFNKSSVARQAAVLEEGGFITRKPSPSDKRVMELYPTEKTLEILPQVREILRQWEHELTDELSEEEVEALSRILAKMKEKAAAPQIRKGGKAQRKAPLDFYPEKEHRGARGKMRADIDAVQAEKPKAPHHKRMNKKGGKKPPHAELPVLKEERAAMHTARAGAQEKTYRSAEKSRRMPKMQKKPTLRYCIKFVNLL